MNRLEATMNESRKVAIENELRRLYVHELLGEKKLAELLIYIEALFTCEKLSILE